MDSNLALRAATAIMCLGIVLTTAELLAARRIYAPSGLLSRNVANLQGWFGLSATSFSVLLVVRLCAAVAALLVVALGGVHPLLLGTLLVTTIALGLLMPSGWGGDYHMSLVLLIGLTVAAAFPEGSVPWRAGLAFITIQAVLSYLLSGINKATSESWRGGTAPAGIFSTDAYGHKLAYAWLAKRPWAGRALAWATIAFECSFVAVLFLGPAARPLLALGIGFHVANAFLMGLNGFVFAFVAAYPIIVVAGVTLVR